MDDKEQCAFRVCVGSKVRSLALLLLLLLLLLLSPFTKCNNPRFEESDDVSPSTTAGPGLAGVKPRLRFAGIMRDVFCRPRAVHLFLHKIALQFSRPAPLFPPLLSSWLVPSLLGAIASIPSHSSICCRKKKKQAVVPASGNGWPPPRRQQRRQQRQRKRRRKGTRGALPNRWLRACRRDGGVVWSGASTTVSSTWRLTAGTLTQVLHGIRGSCLLSPSGVLASVPTPACPTRDKLPALAPPLLTSRLLSAPVFFLLLHLHPRRCSPDR